MSKAAIDLGSIAGHTWLIFVVGPVAVGLLVCVTSIVLVYSVDRSDRVKAIKALAPLFFLVRPARSIRPKRSIDRRLSARHQSDRQSGSHDSVHAESVLPAADSDWARRQFQAGNLGEWRTDR